MKPQYLVEAANILFQRCCACLGWQELPSFSIDRSRKSGRCPKCKPCVNGGYSGERGRKGKTGKDRVFLKVEKESYLWFAKKGLSIEEIAKEHNRSREHVRKHLRNQERSGKSEGRC